MQGVLVQAVIVLIPTIVVIVGTAIYYNRTRTDKISQRLFGLEEDQVDDGLIVRMDTKINTIDEKMDELNHQRIQDLEKRLERLHQELDDMNSRLSREERISEQQRGDEDFSTEEK